MNHLTSAHVSSRAERKYSIVPYQEKWKKEFEKNKKKISPIFGELAEEAVHGGSASIVGMSGKSRINIFYKT